MMDIAPTNSAVLRLPRPAGAKGKVIPEIAADLAGAEKIAVLVPDGFGLFAHTLWKHEMPWFSSLHARRGVVLRSVMPSITPVNFAAMLTGTDLAGHGIRSRTENFACETLFDVVRGAGGKSAGIGLSGYTGTLLLARCADIPGDAGTGTDDAVAEQVVGIARNSSPEFLIAQFGRVDDAFHKYGPSSPEIASMLRETDARLARVTETLAGSGYGILIFADHGQHDILPPPEGEGKRGGHGTDSGEDCLVPCTWTR
jgi:predicted AlkP superfamily pyrophosphatase or phosphodiesterase